MLKQRLLTAMVLAPLLIWGVIALPTSVISLLFAVLISIGAAEWVRLMGGASKLSKFQFIALVWVLLVVSGWASQYSSLFYLLMVLSAGWWLYSLQLLRRYRLHMISCEREGVATPFPLTAMPAIGVVLLVPTWISLVVLHNVSPYWLLFLLLLIWGADSGAYFAGRAYGKRKLAPHVSPGKSWEGVAGAVATTLLISLVGGILLEIEGVALFGLVLLAVVTVAFSIVGDLIESLMKRRVGVKDSGAILPGHGGILDRIDSITAAGPIFALGVSLLGVRV